MLYRSDGWAAGTDPAVQAVGHLDSEWEALLVSMVTSGLSYPPTAQLPSSNPVEFIHKGSKYLS